MHQKKPGILHEDEAAALLMIAPVLLHGAVHDGIDGRILVAAADLENIGIAVGNGVVANQLVGLGDGKDVRRPRDQFTPVADDVVVAVAPVEEERRIEAVMTARIGEVQRVFWRDGPEYLHKAHEALEDILLCVLLDLRRRLEHIDTRCLELNLDDGDAVDQERDVAATVGVIRIRADELRLLGNLIARRATGNLARPEEIEVDLLTRMGRVL